MTTTKDDSTAGLTIDPNIKTEVEKNITLIVFGAGQDKILIYNNRVLLKWSTLVYSRIVVKLLRIINTA